MMPQFYSIGHNSFHMRGLPWIDRIVVGLTSGSDCPECEASRERPLGDVRVTLEPKKGREWPDVLGCGSYPLFIVSDRVIADWRSDKVGDFPVGGRVSLIPPFPSLLQQPEPPTYFWLNGTQMSGARMDFDASGFVGLRVCSTCGRRIFAVGATYDRQHARVWPYAFAEGSWTGENVFTTDLSPTTFFCTNAVVECASRHRHTNFRFTRVEDGIATSGKGLAYIR